MTQVENTRTFELTIDAQRCLNRHYSKQGCHRCVDSCSVHALSLGSRGVVTADAQRCNGCGVCLASCPMEAFGLAGWSDQGMLEQMAGENPFTYLTCHVCDFAKGARDWRVEDVCLSAVSLAALFETGLRRSFTVCLGPCMECALANEARHIEQQVDRANALLEYVGSSNAIDIDRKPITLERLVSVSGKRQKGRSSVSSDKSSERGSSLISRFLKGRRRLYGAHRSDDRDDSTIPRHLFAPVVPEHRARLVDAVVGNSGGSEEPWVLPALTVDSKKCGACSACMQFCPTGSIRQRYSDGWFSFWHNPLTCIDCTICINTCPGDALKMQSEGVVPLRAEKLLVSKAAHLCPICGSPAYDDSSSDVCFWCSTEHDMDQVVEEFRRNML